MRYYFRFLLIPLAFGAVAFLPMATRDETLSASEILLVLSFQNALLFPDAIPESLLRYLPFLLFQIVFGTMIYRRFCTASVYFFSRKTMRVKWFLPECGKLFLYALLYVFILVGASAGIVAVFGHLQFDSAFLPLFVYYLLIYALFLLFTTLGVNVLSILFTGSTAFLIVEGICLLNIAVYSILEPVSRKAAGYETPAFVRPGEVEPNFLSDWIWVIRPNFIANLNLYIHNKGFGVSQELIDRYGLDFNLNWSVLYFFILSVGVAIFGCLVIQKHSFIEANQETGGTMS